MMTSSPSNSTKASVISALKACSLFSGLPDAALSHFAEKSHRLEAEKGKVLFIYGEEAQWFYLVCSGWVKLFRETIDGTEAVIDVVSDGSLFGESAIFLHDRYSYSAEVVEDTRLIALPTSLLRYYLDKNPQLPMNMLSHAFARQESQTLEIEHLNTQKASHRIGCFLLRLCPKGSQEAVTLNLPYDKTLIAARLGMKPETFSRALAKLKSDTQLQINGASVTIANVSQLAEYTCSQCSSSFPCEEAPQQITSNY